MSTRGKRKNGQNALRIGIVAFAAVLALLIGWILFVVVPAGSGTRLVGVVLTVLLGVVGVRLGGRIVASRVRRYDVAAVDVEGPISRDGTNSVPGRSSGRSADDIVEAISRADADENARALLVRLNTPGGEVVPSEDIRLAAERFDGPTLAYATDTCASGGYWIASGCDGFFAREGSVIGSIGVIGSRPNASELANRLGIEYERFAAGAYKDAGTPLKEVSDDERAYLQGIVDDYYEQFVDRVAAGRDLDPATVRETEARVFLGTEALEHGLIDEIGTEEDARDRLAERLGEQSVTLQEFKPSRGVRERLQGSVFTTAYAFGAGIASVLGGEDAPNVRIRL